MYRIFHIFQEVSIIPEKSYVLKNETLKKILLKLNLIKEAPVVKNDVHFSHSIISPIELQKVIQEQITLLRMNNLEPFCIFIGNKDYSDLCEYSDLNLIQQVSYLDSISLIEEFQKTIPTATDPSLNSKVFDFIKKETSDMLYRKVQQLPGSLIASGYKFLNVPLVILPWLGGVFVAPNLSSQPNTTLI